jgi:hypothetical protein
MKHQEDIKSGQHKKKKGIPPSTLTFLYKKEETCLPLFPPCARTRANGTILNADVGVRERNRKKRNERSGKIPKLVNYAV